MDNIYLIPWTPYNLDLWTSALEFLNLMVFHVLEDSAFRITAHFQSEHSGLMTLIF